LHFHRFQNQKQSPGSNAITGLYGNLHDPPGNQGTDLLLAGGARVIGGSDEAARKRLSELENPVLAPRRHFDQTRLAPGQTPAELSAVFRKEREPPVRQPHGLQVLDAPPPSEAERGAIAFHDELFRLIRPPQ